MNNSYTNIGGYTYWTELLDPQSVLDKTEARINELRAKKDPQAGWVAYNLGRTRSNLRYRARLQAEGLHSSSLVVDGKPVCNCALIADVNSEDDSLILAPGHLNNVDQSVITIFYVNKWSDECQSYEIHRFCQTCGFAEEAHFTGHQPSDEAIMDDFRGRHQHDEESTYQEVQE